ncbi:hypothetical protein [Pseudoalteromonas sp. SK18]|uniref:hypothetical protein n=1 Tax=Pseudoalteromonas sp. SK18 TaxID=1938366 RepID=UPI0009764221|nr:hypothetical protein [Pseudoalteromonas sp. SK18]
MKFDFKNDWKEHVRHELLSLGFKYNDNKNVTENSINFFNVNRRLPKKAPRKAVFSKEFCCPIENKNGLNALVKKIEKGECLTPNLSKTISKADYNDATLDDWGIHHFHLGNKEINGVIERTKNVAFVLVLFDCALFIQILAHGKGHSDVWVNTSLVEIIHTNWPESISHMKTDLSGTSLTSTERTTLRKKNANVDIEVSDGTVYFAPGGGRMSNGASMSDFMNLQRIYRDLDYLEAVVNQESDQIKQKITASNGTLDLRVDFSNTQKLRVIEVNSKTMLDLQK